MSAATAPATENNRSVPALLLEMKGDISTLMERSKHQGDALRDLREDFDHHRRVTEAKASKTRETLAFFRGEWKTLLLAIGLVVEHFWNATRAGAGH